MILLNSVTAVAVVSLSGAWIAPAQTTSDAFDSPACRESDGLDGDLRLQSIVAPPDPSIIDIFGGAGATDISVHDLTAEESRAAEKALSRLPRLHRDILQRHLRRLSFLDLEPGGGSALTSRADFNETNPQFDITLRSSLLDESLNTFLNTKEARLFADDGSGFSVAFDAGESDALTYILLHEATHIVDQVLGLTDDETGPFRVGLWDDLRTSSAPYASSPAMDTPFRRQPPVPIREAPTLYEALQETPFVTFYATAAAPEDLAELVAWQQLASRFGQSLTLTVRNEEGDIVYRYEPLKSPAIRARFEDVQALLAQYERACASQNAPSLE